MKAPGIAVAQCRCWLEWAATQVDASLAKDRAANSAMLASIGTVMQAGQARAAADLSAAVIAVQAHDRITQQLSHVATLLRALSEHLGDAQRADSPESWQALRSRQATAFSTPEERALFASIVAGEVSLPAPSAEIGEIEMFHD